MFGAIIVPEIRELIAERNFSALREIFRDWDPADLAELVSDLPEGERVVIFRLLPHTVSADVFEYLDLDNQQHLLRAMAHEEAVAVLNEMSPDDRTALLEELPSNVVTQLLRLLSPEERRIAQTLLNYPEDSVGRLMTPDFLAVRDEWTVEEALAYIREHGKDTETLNHLYILDDRGRLVDDIRIRELLIIPLEQKISDIRDANFVALRVTDPQSEAVKLFRKYDKGTIPVVDGGGVLVGIVTVDDVMDVAEEEATKEIQRIGGTEALDEPYLNLSALSMLRKRGPWLIVLLIGEMFTATALARYEHQLAQTVLLALFLPLIISSGGNSGSQASTLIIRAMALGEVHLRDWWRVMRKELISGALLGTLLGVLGGGRIALWSYSTLQWNGEPAYGPHWGLLSLTIGLALAGVTLWGTLAGSMLPFALRRFGLDPATSSAPFVATLVDVTGVMIYLNVAMWILTGTLL